MTFAERIFYQTTEAANPGQSDCKANVLKHYESISKEEMQQIENSPMACKALVASGPLLFLTTLIFLLETVSFVLLIPFKKLSTITSVGIVITVVGLFFIGQIVTAALVSRTCGALRRDCRRSGKKIALGGLITCSVLMQCLLLVLSMRMGIFSTVQISLEFISVICFGCISLLNGSIAVLLASPAEDSIKTTH